MMDLEKALSLSSRIENILTKHYGASGSGFLSLVNSIKEKLTEPQFRDLRAIGTVRNQLAHGDLHVKDIPPKYEHTALHLIGTLEPPATVMIPKKEEECAELLFPLLRKVLHQSILSIEEGVSIVIRRGHRSYRIVLTDCGTGSFTIYSKINATIYPEFKLIQYSNNLIQECAFYAQTHARYVRFTSEDLTLPPGKINLDCGIDCFHAELSSFCAAINSYIANIDHAIWRFCDEAKRL